MQDAPQADSQQYVSTHGRPPAQPFAEAVVQCWPCLLLQAPLASQVPEQWPLGSSLPETNAHAWFVPHATHVPVQSVSTQHWSVVMQAPLQDLVPAPQT
jgi:hypothetical protein